MRVRLDKTEEAACTWCIEVFGADPHDIEERDSAIAYVEEICALMGYSLKWYDRTCVHCGTNDCWELVGDWCGENENGIGE